MDKYALTNDAIMRQMGTKLKDLRIERNMKQAELADASGVSVFTISSVEKWKGIIVAYYRTVAKGSWAFGLS